MPRAPVAVLAAIAWAGLAACRAGSEAPKAAPARDAVLAIVHVNVVDVTGGAVQADRTVLVTSGRIERVAPAGDVPLPDGARVVDGSGRWLVPGLWDMHAHTSRPKRDLALYVAN